MIERSYLDQLQKDIEALETELSKPETVSNQARFQELMSRHAHHKKVESVASAFFSLQDRIRDANEMLEASDMDPELIEMAEEDKRLAEEALPDAEKKLMIALLPPRSEDSKNIIMEIRAGTGGDEAALFAGDLYRMYTRFAEANGMKINIMDSNPSNIGGYKEIVFAVEGKDTFMKLRYESGVHRVQRIPVTEAGGRIHTSAATVAVMPEAEDVEVLIRPDELRIDIFRSSGPGGQSVNTTDSAVRITHIPTGIVVQCQDEKSQHRNKEKAMRVLRARLYDAMLAEEAAKTASARKAQIGSGDRSERIRTYNYPDNRVTDHRINLTLYSLDRIMAGQIDPLIDALYDHDVSLRLENELNMAKPEA